MRALALTFAAEADRAAGTVGHTNRDIAAELFISIKTASVHVSNIMSKLGVASRGEAAAIAYRLGLGDQVPPT